jgi:signal transduction histidine kinase
MSEELCDRMFNAFERERTSTASGVEGTGLGLAITRGIVDSTVGRVVLDKVVRFQIPPPHHIISAARHAP